MALTKVTGGVVSTTSNYQVGVITATKFVGDGSGLENLKGGGIGDGVGNNCGLEQVFITPVTLTLGGSGCGIVTISSNADSGNLALVRSKNITIATGSTVHIDSGVSVRTNIFGVF